MQRFRTAIMPRLLVYGTIAFVALIFISPMWFISSKLTKQDFERAGFHLVPDASRGHQQNLGAYSVPKGQQSDLVRFLQQHGFDDHPVYSTYSGPDFRQMVGRPYLPPLAQGQGVLLANLGRDRLQVSFVPDLR